MATDSLGPSLPVERLSPSRLRQLFEPRSVALVGASEKNSWSGLTHAALTQGEFPGRIHYVNPRSPTAHGRRTVSSLAEIEDDVDLAFLMVPQAAVLGVLEEAADAGVRNAVVLTAGFAEAGLAGRDAQAALAALAARRDLAVIGPNTLGFLNLPRKTVLYPGVRQEGLKPGGLALVTQSGALGGTMLGYCAAHDMRLSLLVATGNEAVVTLTDVVDYLVEDEETRAIALFCESIRSPAELIRVAERARDAVKPIVALKVGRSEITAQTAQAHTGAMVGDDRVIDAVFRQCGIIRVESLEQLVTTASLLVRTGPLRGRRLGVGAISGGACDIIADRCEQDGVELPPFGPETSRRLGELLPSYGTAHNPLDVTGAAVSDPSLFGRVLDTLAADSFDLLLCLYTIPSADSHPVLLEAIGHISRSLRGAGIPGVLAVSTGQGLTPDEKAIAEEHDVPYAGGLDLVLGAIGHAMRWSEWLRHSPRDPDPAPEARTVLPAGERRAAWSEQASRELLGANGIPLVPAELATTSADAVRAADATGYPVVLKIVSPDLMHKSDVGGVRLDLQDADAVRTAFDLIMDAVSQLSPAPRVEGVLVSPMRPGGVELLVGVVRDPEWGHVLAVGLGGLWAEVLADTSLRLLPVTPADVHGMLTELRGAPLLEGARGTVRADLDALIAAIVAVARLAHALGDDLAALEINPLRVAGSQIEALDALISWSPSTTNGAQR